MKDTRFSINELIKNQNWLELFIPKNILDNECSFKFQIASIKEINKSELPLEKLNDKIFLEQGKIIMFTLEVINLSKSTLQNGLFYKEIIIQDEDGYSFVHSINEVFCESEFTSDSFFRLLPKIKTRIMLFYLLPDEESNYFISIKNSKWTETKLRII